MNKAAFFDRDGVINIDYGFVGQIENYDLIDGVPQALCLLRELGYYLVLVTNQSGIARGKYTESDFFKVTSFMQSNLSLYNACFDKVYFCPHHPHKGYDGEIPELKIDCDCRKPRIGMLRKAAERFNIDLSQSWFIGDTTMDIQTGKNAGTKTMLVKTGEAGMDGKYDVKPDYIAGNLLDAVKLILNEKERNEA